MRLICYSSKQIGQTDWLHKLIAKGREIKTKIKPKKVVALKTDCKSERKQKKQNKTKLWTSPLSLSLSHPPTHPPSNFSRLFIISLKSFNPSSFQWKQNCPFCCCCCVDWSCSNFQHELFLRELFKQRLVWAWRASILPHSTGNNIVPFVVVVVVVVVLLIEVVVAIFLERIEQD
jgi:hypothetical protein